MKNLAAIYAKFLVAAAAALGAAGVAIEDGTVSAKEWIAIGIAVVGALGVAAVPNRPAAEGGGDDRGDVNVGLLVIVVVIVVAIFWAVGIAAPWND